MCCWRHHGSALMFYFSAIVSTSTHQSQTTVAQPHTQLHTYAQFMHSHPTLLLLPHTSSPFSYSALKDRFDTLSSTVLGLISCHPTTAFFTVDLTHFSFPLQTLHLSLSFLILCCSLSLSLYPPPPPPASFFPISRLLSNCAPLI